MRIDNHKDQKEAATKLSEVASTNTSEEQRFERERNVSLAVKACFILILALFLVFVYSRSDASDADLIKVDESLKTETDCMSVMSKADDRDLIQFIGLNSDSFEQVIYYRSTKALAVEELLIVKAKSQDQLSDVEEAVQERIDAQIKAYSGYGPEQVKQLENAVRTKKGNYYFYCTADEAEDYEEVLLNAI